MMSTSKSQPTPLKAARSGILNRINAFRKDQNGVAAIEFALILPVMLSFYFMLTETANGLRASRKVTIVTRAVADLASRQADLSTANINDIFSAADPIMKPFPTSAMGMRMTSIRFDATGRGTVDWSSSKGSSLAAYARCTSLDVINTATGVTIPDALKVPNSSLVLAEAQIPYKPVVGELITGEIDLRDRLYMRPRISEFVTQNGTVNPACP